MPRVKALKKFMSHKPGDVFSTGPVTAQVWVEMGLVEELGAVPKAKPAPSGTKKAAKAAVSTDAEKKEA